MSGLARPLASEGENDQFQPLNGGAVDRQQGPAVSVEQDIGLRAVQALDPTRVKYQNCIDTAFLEPETVPSLEEVRRKTRELNPDQTDEKLFTARTWDVGRFEETNLPVVAGQLKDKEAFGVQRAMRILDLPIKMPGQGWKIPEELAQFQEAIALAVAQERMVNPDFDDDYYAYIIVDQKVVQPGQNQRRAGYHSDAFVTGDTELEVDGEEASRKVDRTYIVYDTLPTGFIPGPMPLDCDPEDCEQVLESFAERSQDQNPRLYPTHTVLRLDPYDLHTSRTNETEDPILRTFVKISFSKSVYNREGNDVNPHFNYNWTLVPRDPAKREHRNHIIGADRVDRDQFLAIDPKSIDFENDEIPWIEPGVFTAHKTEGVHAVPAIPGEKLETKVGNFLVTVNTAKEGYWKVTTSQGDEYFLDGKRFHDNYENEPDAKGICLPKGMPRKMVKLSRDVCFVAPWGGMQYVPKGGVLVVSDKYDIYGIHPSNFEASFARA
ncbi:hypothetical protein IPG41_05185 [Candidatus Peregrinibacteria bacterium]|nr:MAG: hypothetical protein IPG41_05185 [Candidatus Peregrinibacteria bacterium]